MKAFPNVPPSRPSYKTEGQKAALAAPCPLLSAPAGPHANRPRDGRTRLTTDSLRSWEQSKRRPPRTKPAQTELCRVPRKPSTRNTR